MNQILRNVLYAGAGLLVVWGQVLLAQSNRRAVFVANDGNLEGSVTAFAVRADDSVEWVDKVVTGFTNDPNNDPHPGTNAHTISLTPNGRFLAVGHTTAADITEQVTILEVHPDTSLTVFATFLVPDSPFVVNWLDDTYLAVTLTALDVTNEVRVYQFDPGTEGTPSLTLVDSETTGSFTTSLALHPTGMYLFSQSTFPDNHVTSFVVNAGNLDFLDMVVTSPTFPLGLGVTPDGTKLYAGGGISSGGNAILGFTVHVDGMLQSQAGSPYTSPGASPSQVAVSSDSKFAYAGHGTDATIQVFQIDAQTGELTSTGHFFDVGIQGSLGELEVLGDLLFALDKDTAGDGVRGLYSFTIQNDGSLSQNGALVDTQGSRPTELSVWDPGTPPCPADLAAPFGLVDEEDLRLAVSLWTMGDTLADLNGDGSTDLFDLLAVLEAFGSCP